MALDPEKYEKLRNHLDKVTEEAPIQDENREFINEEVLEPAFEEMDELVGESRPPRLYVFGRSGAGKSSLINALANKNVADVGAVEPTTVESEIHEISFSDRYAKWEVVDSRGLFESVSPEGGLPADTVSFLKEDLEEYRPDLLIHVMTPNQVRSGKDDFEVVEQLRKELDGMFPPVVYCLNQVDTFMSPGEDWPPENNPSLAGDIEESLNLVSKVLGEKDKSAFYEDYPSRGYLFDSEDHIGVVPVYLKDEPYWNVEVFSWFIRDFLPKSARLQFAQAQRREALMRDMSKNVTNKFAGIAASVGAAPLPVGDMAVLSSMQLALVYIIGAFSCRELDRSTVKDYLAAMGGTTVTGLAARGIARTLIQMVPVGGQAISAAIAYAGTYAVGHSAEKFFFDDEVVKPSALVTEGKDIFEKHQS